MTEEYQRRRRERAEEEELLSQLTNEAIRRRRQEQGRHRHNMARWDRIFENQKRHPVIQPKPER